MLALVERAEHIRRLRIGEIALHRRDVGRREFERVEGVCARDGETISHARPGTPRIHHPADPADDHQTGRTRSRPAGIGQQRLQTFPSRHRLDVACGAGGGASRGGFRLPGIKESPAEPLPAKCRRHDDRGQRGSCPSGLQKADGQTDRTGTDDETDGDDIIGNRIEPAADLSEGERGKQYGIALEHRKGRCLGHRRLFRHPTGNPSCL